MEREELLTTLAAERTWDDGSGVTVLRASAELPQLAERVRRARRFNRYYRRMLRAFFLYCEQELLPEAKASLAAALSRSAPWEAARCELRYAPTLRREGLLSLRTELCQSAPRLVICRADTWDLRDMLPVPLAEWFPPHVRVRARVLAAVRAQAAERLARGEAEWRADYRGALRRALSLRNYYLTPDALHLFYPMYALGGVHEGVPDFSLPYDAAGPFPPPET